MFQTLANISRIYEENADKIYRYFFYKTFDKTLSEDLVGLTFLKYVKSLNKDTPVEHSSSYMYGIARHVFADYLREKYQLRTVQNADNNIDAKSFQEYENQNSNMEQIESTTLEDMIIPYIGQLSEIQQKLVTLRLIEKCSPSEIAILIGKNQNYVKTTLKRAYKSLRKLIQEDSFNNFIENDVHHMRHT